MPKYTIKVRTIVDTKTEPEACDIDDRKMTVMILAMDAFNQLLRSSGVLVSLSAFRSTIKGTSIPFNVQGLTFPRGPFRYQSILTGGWIIAVENFDEALTWANKLRLPTDNRLVEVKEVHDDQDTNLEDLVEPDGLRRMR